MQTIRSHCQIVEENVQISSLPTIPLFKQGEDVQYGGSEGEVLHISAVRYNYDLNTYQYLDTKYAKWFNENNLNPIESHALYGLAPCK